HPAPAGPQPADVPAAGPALTRPSCDLAQRPTRSSDAGRRRPLRTRSCLVAPLRSTTAADARGAARAGRRLMRTHALLFGLVLLGCTGADPGGACRGDDDCGDAESCAPPGAPTGCGIPCPIERGCERDDECDGDVCVEFVASCCF